MQLPSLHTGPWRLEDLRQGKLGQPKHGLKVFSCFHCGGGSSMGYKLAGFDVLGGVEIDPQMMELYRKNHEPKHSYLMGIQEFNKIPDDKLPNELFELDVLDGSPPCSSFSMAGSREKAWGQEKKFREGQSKQILDDLFFHFIDTVTKLKPKMVVAENVKGLIQGNAKGYVKEIFERFDEAGYETQLFLLNASRMGVPQARERTFFIARRKELTLPRLKLEFNENPIPLIQALKDLPKDLKPGFPVDGIIMRRWSSAPIGGHPKTETGNTFGFIYRSNPAKPCSTITAHPRAYHWAVCRRFNQAEVTRIQSFPDDYNYIKEGAENASYICGMSVPPLMMQRVASNLALLLGIKLA